MRSFEERKAEVFLRSNERIKERNRKNNRILLKYVPLCLSLVIFSLMMIYRMIPSGAPAGNDSVGSTLGGSVGLDGNTTGKTNLGSTIDPGGESDSDGNDVNDVVDFNGSFSITWNVFGISSYDSATGKLIKTTDATNPEDYVTTLHLTGSQLFEIWELIWDLDIETYPDEYDPQEGELASDPSMTLILTVKTEDFEKTIRAEDIAISYISSDAKGQKFLDACKGIVEVLTSSEEWKALPDYETLYE